VISNYSFIIHLSFKTYIHKIGVKGHREDEREDNIIETPPKSIILESTLSRHKREEVVPADAAKEDAVEVVGETKLLCGISMGNNLCTRLATGCYCIITTQVIY